MVKDRGNLVTWYKSTFTLSLILNLSIDGQVSTLICCKFLNWPDLPRFLDLTCNFDYFSKKMSCFRVYAVNKKSGKVGHISIVTIHYSFQLTSSTSSSICSLGSISWRRSCSRRFVRTWFGAGLLLSPLKDAPRKNIIINTVSLSGGHWHMVQHVGKIEGHLPQKFVGRLSIDCRPTVGRQIAKPTVGRQFFHFLKTEKCWPTNDRQSVNCSVTCRQSVGNGQRTMWTNKCCSSRSKLKRAIPHVERCWTRKEMGFVPLITTASCHILIDKC